MYTIIYICLSMLANSWSQFLLDRLRRCLKLFISTESISCHEFASQFGLAIFLYAKNTQNYREYCVAYATVYLNDRSTQTHRTATSWTAMGGCVHVRLCACACVCACVRGVFVIYDNII